MIEAGMVEELCESIGIEEVFRMSAKTGMRECVNKSSLHHSSSIGVMREEVEVLNDPRSIHSYTCLNSFLGKGFSLLSPSLGHQHVECY